MQHNVTKLIVSQYIVFLNETKVYMVYIRKVDNMLWKKIEEQLNKKGWTIYRVTKEANISQNTLYELKSGRVKDINFKTMIKIADALGISLDEFRE